MGKVRRMKSLCLLLLVGILVFAARIPVRAEGSVIDSGTDGTISWELTSDGVLTISGTGVIEKEWNWSGYEYADSITSIVIEEGITGIGEYGFTYLDNVVKISIPASLESMGETDIGIMVYMCTSLVEFDVDANNANYCSIDGILYNKDVTKLIRVPQGATEVSIPNTVKEIGNSAFYSCDSLETLSLPDGLQVIGDGAFVYCCTNDADLTLPSSLTTIGDSAFYSSSVLSGELTVPANVTYIGECAFLYCSGLTKINFDCDITEIGAGMLAHCANLASITIPASVTSIGEWAFEASGYRVDSVEIIFEGDAPSFADDAFSAFTATAYYPAGNSTWTKNVMQDYEGTITWVSYESAGTDISLAKCNVSYINNTMNGLKVVWNKVSGATGYYIYRKNNDGTYSTTPTATVTGGSTTEWTDTSTLTGGKDYTYKVAAYYKSSDGTITVGSSGTTKTCKYLKGGEVTSVVNSSTGLKVTWTKVSGANGYYIFRKSSSDSDYTQVATVSGTSVVSWTDTSSLTSGKDYTYKVSAIFTNNKGQVTKGGAKTTKTAKYLTPGKISSLTNTSTGITVKWSKVSGASGYYVYRKASSASSYTLVKTITSVSTVSYTDTAVKSKNGTTYTYYVIPYYKSSSGAVTKGAYSATKKTVRLTAVSLSSVKNSSSKKMTVKWAKNSKATGYEIQYSTSSSFASGNKTVTVSSASTVSKVISSLTKGKTYYVRIRAYKTVSGTKYYSAWSSKKSVKISK